MTLKKLRSMTPEQRLKRIAEIIWGVDQRCCAADGPVPPTLTEMRQSEIQEIYDLAIGYREIDLKAGARK
jgi:hypothetical protein